jgi:hypothetical protein
MTVEKKRPIPDSDEVGVSKRPRSDGSLSVQDYRARLQNQGKYSDLKPGSRSLDGCLKDPPQLPPAVKVINKRASIPERGEDGCFVFPDHPSFKPNLSPKEVLQLGSFGGTYFRDIISAVTGDKYKGRDVVKEFPQDWFEGLDLDVVICSPSYSKHVNQYKVSCGASLGQWECSGWISELDPYGWFQWYCRFFLGRRSTDDERQIDRWMKGQGPTGRWRSRLCNEIIKAHSKIDNMKVSPVIRQVLQHWAYQLTSADLEKHCNK